MPPFTRTRGFIPWTKIDTWLRGFRSIWVSTTRPDGRPHAVPVWYIWDGQCLYFLSGPTSQKTRNLAAQPHIVVHAGDGDDAIILEGAAALVTDPAEREQVNRAYMAKYVDPHSGAQASVAPTDTLFRVTVQRVLCWEYGVIATRTDWKPEPQ